MPAVYGVAEQQWLWVHELGPGTAMWTTPFTAATPYSIRTVPPTVTGLRDFGTSWAPLASSVFVQGGVRKRRFPQKAVSVIFASGNRGWTKTNNLNPRLTANKGSQTYLFFEAICRSNVNQHWTGCQRTMDIFSRARLAVPEIGCLPRKSALRGLSEREPVS